MLYTVPHKKTSIVCILEILKQYTDSEHTLTQSEIQQKLRDEYSLAVDRKAVKRNLMNLVECDYNIQFKEVTKIIKNKKTGKPEETKILTDFYFQHDFESYELKLLIDSIIFSNHIPDTFRKDLIKKLEGLSNTYFKNSTHNIEISNSITAQNLQWFMNIESINDAINNNNKISFTYNKYNEDKKLTPECEITASPYKMVAANSHYYLVCTEEPFDGFSHYRVDRITDMRVLEDQHFTPSKTLDIKKYLSSHPYMSSGKEQNIKMTVDRGIIDNIIDYFGDEFRITNKSKGYLGRFDIELKSNLDDMYYWALQFGDHVQIKEPQELRDRIRGTVEDMSRKYFHTNEDRFQKAMRDAKRRRGCLDLSWVDMTDKTIDAASMNIREIYLRDYPGDLAFLKDFEGLESIHIRGKVGNFDFLNGMDCITRLMLWKTGFNDLSLVRDMHLKRLGLNEETVENLDVLYTMTDLKELQISRNLAESIDIDRLKSSNPELRIMLLRDPRELRPWDVA